MPEKDVECGWVLGSKQGKDSAHSHSKKDPEMLAQRPGHLLSNSSAAVSLRVVVNVVLGGPPKLCTGA